jgi:DNA primase
MRYERMEFPEAVEALAKKAGVVLPKAQFQDTKEPGISAQLYKINEFSASFYANNLNSPSGSVAKNYLLKRGIKTQVIESLKLGYALQQWDGLINQLRQKGISLSLIEKAGLILPKDGGGYYDRFRNRIIFPITDIKSRVLGFGARVLDETLPKYVNSPETPIYTKGKNLYGLDLAKDSIRDKDFAVIVEGYLDFILPYQEGLQNIIASQGTALTIEQIRLLKRYTNNLVLVYDADNAGELATLRTLDLFIEEGVRVGVVSLPKGDDPDSFVRKYGIADFKAKVEKAQNLFDYKLGVLKGRFNPKEIESKARISSLMLETINKFKNAVLKTEYLKKLAQDLDIREDALIQEIKKIKEDKPRSIAEASSAPKRRPDIHPTERLLIKLILEEKEFIDKIKQNLEPADFRDQAASRIISIMFELIDQEKSIEPSVLMNYISDEDIFGVLGESVFTAQIPPQDKEKVVDDCIRRLKSERLKSKKNYLHDQIKLAQATGDQERLDQLMREFNCLVKKG